MPTVSETYKIDEEQLYEMAEKTGDKYWDNAYEFYMKVKDDEVENLSQKQQNWLESIENDLSYDGCSRKDDEDEYSEINFFGNEELEE